MPSTEIEIRQCIMEVRSHMEQAHRLNHTFVLEILRKEYIALQFNLRKAIG